MRQLFSVRRAALAVAAYVLLQATHMSAADAKPAPSQLDQELLAAQLTEGQVLARITDDGKSEASQRDMDKIAGIYADIIKRNPQNVKALNADAEFLWKVERYHDAIMKWTTAESIEPNNAEVINHLAACHLKMGDETRATRYFERAADLEPKNALYQFNAGNTCFLFRRQMADSVNDAEAVAQRSLEHFKQASKIEPFNVEYARAYAETFYGMKAPNWNDALTAWSHYLEITDQKDFAYSNIARVNLKLGHKQEAREALAKINSEKFKPVKAHLMEQMGKE